MIKRILSFTIVLTLIISCLPLAHAADVDYSAGTRVEWSSTQTAEYTITVPAKLKPAQEGPVTLTGSWPSNLLVNVTADKDVNLVNSINPNESKTVNVLFPGISETGSNTEAVTFTKNVSVEDVQGVLFGVWNGTFNYNVTTQEIASNPTANMRLAIATPSSKQSDNPTLSPVSEYTISGSAFAERGIKSLTISVVEEKELIVTSCTEQAMGMHQLLLENFLSEADAEALQGKTATYTNMDGETLDIVLFQVSQSAIRISDAYYNKMGPMRAEIAQKGKCSMFVVNNITTEVLDSSDMQDGNWNLTVTLPANSTTTINVILEDELGNTVESCAYAAYSEYVPFQYGAYRTGAIDIYLEEGPDAAKNKLYGTWDDIGPKVYSDGSVYFTNRFHYDNVDVELIIPESAGITYLSESSLKDTTGICGLYLPNTVTKIKYRTMDYLGHYGGSPTTLSLPASLENIEEDAFYGTSAKIVLAPDNPHYRMVDGVIYTTDMKTLVYATRACSSNYTIPEGVTTISKGAFRDSTVTSVTLPNTVTDLRADTFSGSNIQSVRLSNKLTFIWSYVFYDCTSLETIEFPDGVTEFSHGVFQSCDALKSVILPASLTKIGPAAFHDCPSLDTIYFTGTEEQWASVTIDGYNDAVLNATVICNYVP